MSNFPNNQDSRRKPPRGLVGPQEQLLGLLPRQVAAPQDEKPEVKTDEKPAQDGVDYYQDQDTRSSQMYSLDALPYIAAQHFGAQNQAIEDTNMAISAEMNSRRRMAIAERRMAHERMMEMMRLTREAKAREPKNDIFGAVIRSLLSE